MKMLDATAINYAKSQKLNGSNATIERALAEAFKAGYEYRKRLSFAETYTPSDVLPKTIDPLRTSVDSWRKR
jgi:hypothetical protein